MQTTTIGIEITMYHIPHLLEIIPIGMVGLGIPD